MTDNAINHSTVTKSSLFVTLQKIGLGLFSIGILFALISLAGVGQDKVVLFLVMSFGLPVIGGTIYILTLSLNSPGIKNDRLWFRSLTSRGLVGWMLGVILTTFYIVLYWFPEYLENWVRLTDPISYVLNGKAIIDINRSAHYQ